MAKKSLRRLEEYLAKIAPENFNAALVMMGYGDLFGIAGRTLNFRTERMGVEDARKIVKIVRSYGEFSGATVARVLGMLASRIHAVEFGREYSPVLADRTAHAWLRQAGRAGCGGKRAHSGVVGLMLVVTCFEGCCNAAVNRGGADRCFG